MVFLNVKVDGVSQFLIETTLTSSSESVLTSIVSLYNGRLKVERMADQLGEMAKHGVAVKPEMRGLLEDQIQELKLQDEDAEDRCKPEGGSDHCKDPLQRRCGTAPKEAHREMMARTAMEALAMISVDKVKAGKSLSMADVKEAVAVMGGAVSIVYPMGLPEYDPFRMEAENAEEEIPKAMPPLDPAEAVLWFANKELEPESLLSAAMGKNEKTKVIVKLSTKKKGRPVTESLIDEVEQRRLMEENYKRMEELRRMAKDEDDSYLDSKWADGSALKNKFNGLGNISWK